MSAPKAVIYYIKHRASGRTYVGGTGRKIAVRFREHISALRYDRHKSSILQKYWNKYGEKAFQWDIIERCQLEDIISREQFWINEIKPFFNIRPVSKSCLGRAKTADHKKKIGAANKGKRRTSEQKLIIKQAIKKHWAKKKQMPEWEREQRRISVQLAYEGKKGEALRAKISARVKEAHKKDPTIAARIAAKNTGRKRPKQGEAMRAAWARGCYKNK